MVLSLTCGCATFMEYGKLEKSARQDYRTGNYDQAVFNCVQALKLKPGYGKAQTLVKDAYAAAVGIHQGRIRELSNSSGRLRWDETVSEYEALMELNRAMGTLPALVDGGTGE